MSARPLTTRLEEYWGWFAVALFVLVTLDMITTMYAAWYVGPAAESNPFVRFALARGVLTYAILNLAASVVAVGGFYALVKQLESSDPPHDRYVEYGVQIWLGLLIAVGLFVFANNLAVIVHGRSLL